MNTQTAIIFTDGVSFPEEFLNAFDVKLIGNGDKNLFFKCSFVIANYQPPAIEGGVPIYDSRFWSPKTYEGFYFNEYIKYSLAQGVFKRIIVNAQASSSWRFYIFQSISVIINTDEDQQILR